MQAEKVQKLSEFAHCLLNYGEKNLCVCVCGQKS